MKSNLKKAKAHLAELSCKNQIKKEELEQQQALQNLEQAVLKGMTKEHFKKARAKPTNQRKRKFGEDAGIIYMDIVKSASNDKENLESYVNLFMDLDRVNKEDYSNGMLNPYEAFYSGVEKEEIEKAANDHVLLATVPVPVGEITNSETLVKQCFNKKDQEDLLSIVSLSKEGGIKAAMKIMDLDQDLQTYPQIHCNC